MPTTVGGYVQSPVYCVRFPDGAALTSVSTVRTLEPFDDLKSCDFHISYDTPHGVQESHFTVDTEVSSRSDCVDGQQSAMQWRRNFEAALYRHARARWREREATREGLNPEEISRKSKDEWAMMRCCVPLDRVTVTGISDFHSFATLVSLDIALNELEKVQWNPEHLTAGDLLGPDGDRAATKHTQTMSDPPKRKTLSIPVVKRNTSSPRPGDATPPRISAELHPTRSTTYISSTLPPHLAAVGRNPELADIAPESESNSYQFNLAILNAQEHFAETLQSAVSAAAHGVYKPGAQRPRMVMSIAGMDCLAGECGRAIRSDVLGDDELEHGNGASSKRRSSTLDSLQVGEDESDAAHALHKAEKAAMAAKIFGLKEDEGIWRTSQIAEPPDTQ